VDDTTLIGLPHTMLIGDADSLAEPDAVIIDDIGAGKMFGVGVNPVGERLELNDRRAIIRGVVDATPTFTSQVFLYTRYSRALTYVPGTRNRMSFVLARAAPGVTPDELAARINEQTEWKARTRDEFAQDGIDFVIENTGIPYNFGITVMLGFIVGVAIVGLTFNLFIRDNIKQFGALKAIGVTNRKIAGMVATQAALVGSVGYAFGILGSVLFIYWFEQAGPNFKGFYSPWQIPIICVIPVIIILGMSGWLGLRSVLNTEPAEVFR
jgi:putative ABC transport system permease protein